MPSGLKRFQIAEFLHFITFSCFHRLPLPEQLRLNRSGLPSCGGISYPMECGWKQANGHPFPPKPQKTRLGWGTNHGGDPKVKDLAGPPARFSLSHSYGCCGWLSIICMRKMGAGHSQTAERPKKTARRIDVTPYRGS